MTEDDVGDIVVPLEVTQSKLKACMSCSLVKTTQQFFQFGCENCPFMGYEGDRERVGACTTSSFIGYVVAPPFGRAPCLCRAWRFADVVPSVAPTLLSIRSGPGCPSGSE